MSANTKNNSRGMSFLGTLALIFLVLKLTGAIDWSWWWVLAPVWMAWALILICIVTIGVMALIASAAKRR